MILARRSTLVAGLGLLAACQSLPAQPSPQTVDPGWSEVASADGSVPTGRGESALAVVGNKLVLIGGRGNPATSIFDLESCTWSEGAPAPFQVHHFQAVAAGEDIYAVGAFTKGYPREEPVANVLIYNLASDSWRTGPEIPESRRRGAAAAVRIGDWIYVLNGIRVGHVEGHVAWADRFNIRSGEWQQLPDSPRARDHLAAAATADGTIVVAGGRRSMAPDRTFQETIAEVDIFDPVTRSWSTTAQTIPTQRAGVSAARFNGMTLFLGGESGSQSEAHSEVEAFVPGKGFTSFPDMLVPRHGFGAVAVNESGFDAVYVAGGVPTRGGGTLLTSVHRLGASRGPCGA